MAIKKSGEEKGTQEDSFFVAVILFLSFFSWIYQQHKKLSLLQRIVHKEGCSPARRLMEAHRDLSGRLYGTGWNIFRSLRLAWLPDHCFQNALSYAVLYLTSRLSSEVFKTFRACRIALYVNGR